MKAQKKETASERASPKTKVTGLKQSWRVLWLGLAFFLFAVTSYWAFFHPQFFSKSWWIHPIEFNASSRQNRVETGVDFTCISALPGGREIWVGGTKGVILHSKDGGNNWEQLPTLAASGETLRTNSPSPSATPPRPPASKASLSLPLDSSARSIASEPPDRDEWMQAKMEETPRPQGTAPVDQRPPDPITQYAPNAPTPSPTLPALTSNDLVSLQFISAAVGYVVAKEGHLLATHDGGQTWQLLYPPDSGGVFLGVRFVNEEQGIIFGNLGISRTLDGGKTWSKPPPRRSGVIFDVSLTSGFKGMALGSPRFVTELVENRADVDTGTVTVVEAASDRLFRITRADRGTLFVCGSQGFIGRSGDGREWRKLGTGVSDDLYGIFFASEQVGWAAGDNGRIIGTKDGGDHWDKQFSGTNARLRALYFSSQTDGFAAGDKGTLIDTKDGGRNWYPVVVADSTTSGSRHRWLPPPLYFAALLVLLGLLRMIPPEIAPPRVEGIGELLVSDKPIGPDDPDYLGFQHVALGLSNYLRNNATNPPLTVAITGEWGMGKSSLMNLLDADLRSYKFRPVWFNAWHHQTEEHLLAALLENVRTQAIPSIFSPEGIVFRAKLLWLRARRNLLAFILVIAAVSFCISYFAHDTNRLWESPQRLQQFLKDPSQKIIDSINPSSEGSKAFFVLISAVGSLITFLKAFRAFGVDPASLLASTSKAAKPGELRAQTSFRYNFSKEFREVTDSLNPLTMVLFVDDLDRCRPEQVYDMLEAVNFLVSCGDCFVVMGLARRRVERCIGLVFDKVAAEGPDHDKGQHLSRQQQRQRFARAYLEKLINIEVPVPKGGIAQNLALLIRKAAERPPRKKIEVVGEKLSSMRPHFVPIALALFAMMVAIWASSQIFDSSRRSPTTAASEATPGPTPADQTKAAPSPTAGLSPSPVLTPSPAPQVTDGPAKFWPGQTGSRPLWAMLLLAVAILTPGLIRLSRRTGAVIEDSPAFLQALEKWFPFLATGNDMTPRSVKRFVNRVRYFAMMQGSFRPVARWWQRLADFLESKSQSQTEVRKDSTSEDLSVGPQDPTPEDMLVALATLYEKHPEWFGGDLDSFIRIVESERQKEENVLRELDLVGLTWEIYEHFKKLVAGVEVR